MAPEILKAVGQVAGIGGLALGILLLLYRDVIRLKVFPKLTTEQAFVIIILLLVLVWSVAILGLGAWAWVTTTERRLHTKNSGEVKPDEDSLESTSDFVNHDIQSVREDQGIQDSLPPPASGQEVTSFTPVPAQIGPMLVSKRYDEAIGTLKDIIGREPLNPEANFMLAEARSRRFVDIKYNDQSAIVSGFPRFICDPLDIYLASGPNGRHAAVARKIQKVAQCDFGYLWSDKRLDAITIMNRRQAESQVARELRIIDWGVH